METGLAEFGRVERLRLLEAKLQEVILEANDLGLAAGPVCERLHALFLRPSSSPGEKARRPRRPVSAKA